MGVPAKRRRKWERKVRLATADTFTSLLGESSDQKLKTLLDPESYMDFL